MGVDSRVIVSFGRGFFCVFSFFSIFIKGLVWGIRSVEEVRGDIWFLNGFEVGF